MTSVSLPDLLADQPQPVTVIEPTSGWTMPKLGDVWRRRELIRFFFVRDLKVRYAQTLLGAFWTLAQPLGMVLVFAFAFRKLGHVHTDGVSYPVYAFAGLTFWLFWSRGVSGGAESLISNAQLLTKTACPRLLMPISVFTSALFDFAISFVVLLVIAVGFGSPPTWRLAFMPVALIVGALLAFGLGLTLATVNIAHRDIRNLLPLVLQVLLFVSPILYSLSPLSDRVRTILELNPLVGLIELFRWSVAASPFPSLFSILAAGIWTAVALVVGFAYFGRAEGLFADVV